MGVKPAEHLLTDMMCVGRAALLRPGEIMRMMVSFETGLGRRDTEGQPFAVVIAPRRKKTTSGKAPCCALYSDARADDPRGSLDPVRCWARCKEALDALQVAMPAPKAPCLGDLLVQVEGYPRLDLGTADHAEKAGDRFRSALGSLSTKAGMAGPVLPYAARHSALPVALQQIEPILRSQGDWGSSDSMWAYTPVKAARAAVSLRKAWRSYDAVGDSAGASPVSVATTDVMASKRRRSLTPKASSHSGSKVAGSGSGAGDASRRA